MTHSSPQPSSYELYSMICVMTITGRARRVSRVYVHLARAAWRCTGDSGTCDEQPACGRRARKRKKAKAPYNTTTHDSRGLGSGSGFPGFQRITNSRRRSTTLGGTLCALAGSHSWGHGDAHVQLDLELIAIEPDLYHSVSTRHSCLTVLCSLAGSATSTLPLA